MTIREQARQAVADAWCDMDQGLVTDDVADAASDVWEPLLRDLLVAYEHAVEHKAGGHTLNDSIFAWGGYTRAKEALG